jgi:hypothetical protein
MKLRFLDRGNPKNKPPTSLAKPTGYAFEVGGWLNGKRFLEP